MKIVLIILLVVSLFIYFLTRPKYDEKVSNSKEKFNELIKDEKRDELLSVIDEKKSDVANVKILRETYGLGLLDAKNLWEHVKPDIRKDVPSDFSNVREIVDLSQGDITNIKTIKDYYQIDLRTAKELWDSIRDEE